MPRVPVASEGARHPSFGTRVADAWLCVCLLLLGEWLAIGLAARRELAGNYELFHGLLSFVPLGMLLAFPLALIGVALDLGLELKTLRIGRILNTSIASLFAIGVGYGVSGGRLLQGGGRPVFVAVLTCLVAVLTWFGSSRLERALLRLASIGQGRLLILVLLATTLALEVVNARVLPRLYPAFHVGIAILTIWVAALGARSLRRRRHSKARRWLTIGFGVLVLAASYGAPARLRHYDNLRFIYLERAPLLGYALQVAGALAPPPMSLPGQPSRPASEGPELDLKGRDILLITVDALRADHVGSYGYSRATTPHIDSLAHEGAFFDAAFTPTPHTSYAITSLMVGKYARPLLRLGLGSDSETWATALRRYGYRTAAFYPPAVFFIDREKFKTFADNGLGFEYRKVQFDTASTRVTQLQSYLAQHSATERLFIWVHLFEPHEPYVKQAGHEFGDRAIDRYDSEIAAADAAIGAMVESMRAARPRSLVIVSADHGEEFGDHGGRYHGSSVYDEQVRVPLIFNAPGLIVARTISQPVGLVDLLPTVLAGLAIPLSPRLQGRSLGPLLSGATEDLGFAFSESDNHTLLARGTLRLICARRASACRLFDVAVDPQELSDASATNAQAFATMKAQLPGFLATIGRFENPAGQRWPRALRRGIAGDIAAAGDVAGLLDDANVAIRRKAAEVLFALKRPEAAVQLRRALGRDEDALVRRWCALALTRLGEGASLSYDLLSESDLAFKRLAALALAETGDDRGEAILMAWWRAWFPKKSTSSPASAIDHARARELAAALGRIKSRDSVHLLVRGLRDVRLRGDVARALAQIGAASARPGLAKALRRERYHDARGLLARALVKLGGKSELRKPLIHFLGVPDPIEGGLELALGAKILRYVGGPRKRELRRLRRFATSGVIVGMVVPESRHASGGYRVLLRARSTDQMVGTVHFGLQAGPNMGDGDRSQIVPKHAPSFAKSEMVTIQFGPSEELQEAHARLPEAVARRLGQGKYGDFVVYATQNVAIDACAVVPLARELAPKPPKPWKPTSSANSSEAPNAAQGGFDARED